MYILRKIETPFGIVELASSYKTDKDAIIADFERRINSQGAYRYQDLEQTKSITYKAKDYSIETTENNNILVVILNFEILEQEGMNLEEFKEIYTYVKV